MSAEKNADKDKIEAVTEESIKKQRASGLKRCRNWGANRGSDRNGGK
jgi:hypothetical protein